MKRLWGLALLVLAGIVAGANPAFAQGFSFTKAFGAASIPLNGTTSLTFNVSYFQIPWSTLSLTRFLRGWWLQPRTGCQHRDRVRSQATVTATAGSSVVSLIGSSISGSCSFSVNVTGTTVGVKNNSVTDAPEESTATASLTVTAPSDRAELQNYFSNAHTTGRPRLRQYHRTLRGKFDGLQPGGARG